MRPLFTSILAFMMISGLFAQNNDFLVGIWLQPGNSFIFEQGHGLNYYNDNDREVIPIQSEIINGYPSSRLNLLADAGLNFVWLSAPSPWNYNSVMGTQRIFNILNSRGIYSIADLDYFFKPVPDSVTGEYHNAIGENDFGGEEIGDEWNYVARPNYNRIIEELDAFDKLIGYMLGGELAYRTGHWYNINGEWNAWWVKEDPSKCFSSAISANTIFNAMDYLRMKTDKAFLLQVGTHKKSLQDYTASYREENERLDGVLEPCNAIIKTHTIQDMNNVNPQDHFQNPNYMPDFVIEGSYYTLNLEKKSSEFEYPIESFESPFSNIDNCGAIKREDNEWYPLYYSSNESCPIINFSGQESYLNFQGDNRHFLSKYHNLDYLTSKGAQVISEFSAPHHKYTKDKTLNWNGTESRGLGNWNSTKVNNGNYFWFNGFNSIIHGAVGVIPYVEFDFFSQDICNEKVSIVKQDFSCEEIADSILASASDIDNSLLTTYKIDRDTLIEKCQENNLCDGFHFNEEGHGFHFKAHVTNVVKGLINHLNAEYDSKTVKRFTEAYQSQLFKEYLLPFLSELSFLRQNGFLKSENVIARKLNHNDEAYCIVPPSDVYLQKQTGDLFTTIGIPKDLYEDIEDEYRPQIDDFQSEFATENYGLRYIMFSNGNSEEEVIMIISNPLNLPVLNVPLDFNKISNKVIQNSIGVQVLFRGDDAQVVTPNGDVNTNYKVQRKLTYDWESSVYDDIPHVEILFESHLNKKLSLDFGPLDVHILRFVQGECCSEVQSAWFNHGNRIGGHSTHVSDMNSVVGNFYKDSAEELLLFSSADRGWVTMQGFDGQNWFSLFNNSGNGWIKRSQSGWKVDTDDVFVSGDFRTGDGKTELLCIQDYPVGNMRVSALIGFDDTSADWDYWYWSNYLNRNFIGEWALGPNTSYYSIKFNQDSKDKLACFRFNQEGIIIEFMIQEFKVSDTWEKLVHIRYPNLDLKNTDKIIFSDFMNLGVDQMLVIRPSDNNSIVRLYSITSGVVNLIWSNQSSPGILGQQNGEEWHLKEKDHFVSGNYLQSNSGSELFIIRNHDELDNLAQNFNAAVFRFNGSNEWYNYWENSACELGNGICNWPVIDGNGILTVYKNITLKVNSVPSPSYLDNLFAIRHLEENGSVYCDTKKTMIGNYYFPLEDKSVGNALIKNYLDNVSTKDKANSNQVNEEVTIYPNPTIGNISIFCNNGGIKSIEIHNSLYMVESISFSENSKSVDFDMSRFNKGLHYVIIRTENAVHVKRVVLF